MLIWGIIAGAVLGMVWHTGDWSDNVVAGAILGGIFGATLRSTIRAEVRKALADRALAPRVVAAPAPVATPRAVAHPPPPIATAAPSITPAPPATSRPAGFADTMPQPEPPPARIHQPKPAPERDPVGALVVAARDWLMGGNTVVRLGVVVLFVGLAFLAKYAIDNSLLPPEVRLAGIAAAGIALFVTGFRLRKRQGVHHGYALTLQGAGVAVLYLTVFAAFRLYGFLPAGAAFAALALVCAFSAVIAVAQDAIALAFIGFAGGFAAPLLVSTGEGSHVALFSYYLLLGVAIAALSWVKAWRPLNLLGFIATFAIATAWGVLKYEPGQLARTEPFLVAFFAVYLVAALAYSLRHPVGGARAVDATLVFGVPLIGFGLQYALVRDIEYAAAFSSLALGALYLVLAAWLVRRRRGDALVQRWLAECFLALGLGFVTLAVPLALDAQWTSAVWAIEGAAVFWMGRRQGRWLARAVGLGLQVFAAAMYVQGESWHAAAPWPLAHPAFLGATLLALAAFSIAWTSRAVPARERTGADAALARIESELSPVFFWAGFLWWMLALQSEFVRQFPDGSGAVVRAYSATLGAHLLVAGWVASAFALHWLALPRRRSPWPIAATPAWTVLPVLAGYALTLVANTDRVFADFGWAFWPIVLVLHFVMLRHLDDGRPQGWWHWVHAGGVWLVVLLAGDVLVEAVGRAHLWHTAWASVILLVAGTMVLLVLCLRRWWSAGRRWPLDRFARDYLWRAAAPLAVFVALGCLAVAVHSDGNARPLPYVPLLNPTDLAVALGLAACALWLSRLRASTLEVPAAARGRTMLAPLAGIAFIAANTVWLRTVHHFAGVPWDAHALFASFLVQAGYSILWTAIAVVLMVAAHRRAQRTLWTVGAGLVGLTVAKLFLIDLSNRGGSERIVAFIAVGILLLVVGYFAPIPPGQRKLGATAS
jgi:uncharacterized membrane protein